MLSTHPTAFLAILALACVFIVAALAFLRFIQWVIRCFALYKKVLSPDEFEMLRHSKPEGSGCYVILLTRPNTVLPRYDHVYIGQSIRVHERVRQHLSSAHTSGNRLVHWAIFKQGCRPHIAIVYCGKPMLNIYEKSLIWAFGARASFNKTRGGGTKRGLRKIH